jgi:hypothetical protein
MNGQRNTQENAIAERPIGAVSRYREQLRADITHYTPYDQAAVLAFRRAMYGAGATVAGAPYVHWLYDDAPNGANGRNCLWLYRKAGQLQAHQGGLRVGLKVGAYEHDAVWLLDLMVSPPFRMRGVGVLLPQIACETTDLALGMEVSDDARRALLRDGWRDLGSVPLYVRPLDLPAVLRQHGYGGAWGGVGRVGNAALWAWDQVQRAGTARVGEQLVEVAEFDERADQLWTRASVAYPVLCRRDHAYLNWRWTRFPDEERYQCFVCMHGDTVIGYAVLRMGEHHGLRAGFLVDFLCLPQHTYTLVAHCLRMLRAQGAQIVYCLHHNPVADRAFRSLGFLRRHSMWPLMLHARNLASEQLALVQDQRNWFITAGDSDADRPREGTMFA